MNGERVDRVEAIFQGALERPPAERSAFLEAACAGDPQLRRAVDRLLGSHEQARAVGFLEEPAALAPASAAEDDGPATGELVGRYRIVDRIGVGGMGAVFLAHDENLGRRVAVKVLKGGPGHDEERARRLRREALAASALNHPNIITIHEVGAWNGRAYMATEFIEGVTLRHLMEGDRLTPAQALDIGVQIAGALSAAHAAGVVHRDVKPDNVMIRPDGLVKVLDFGIAKYGEAAGPAAAGEGILETRPGDIVGTFAYMSPEQARGLETDARTDVWALGCVLFETMAGRAAFARASASATIAAVLEGEPDWTALPETTPAPLRRMIQRCLAKDVGQRLEDMDRARATLDGVQERLVGRAEHRRASGLDQLARRRLEERRSSAFRTETDASRVGRGVERRGSSREWRVAIGAAVAGVCILIALALTGRLRDRAEGTRVAGRTDALRVVVLPILAPPGDGELQLVALAVLDLLTQRLAGTAGLRVRNPEFPARPSAPGSAAPDGPRDAAEGAYAIAGDLRRSESGDRGRLRLQLFEPSAGGAPRRTPLGEYEIPFLHDAPDLAAFAAAREAVVGQVLHLLLPALPLAAPSVPSPRDPEAYRLYLTALPHLRQVTCVGPVALDSLRRSVELDPRFAPAWEELGWARYGLVSSCGESADNYRLAAEAADRALRLAPFRPRATCLKAAVLVESGRAEEAYALLDAAHQRMPDDLDLVFARAYVLTYAGFLDEAVSLVETAAAADPTRSSTLAWSTNAYLHRGDVERFLALQLRSDSPLFRYYRGYAHVLEGRADEARRVLAPAFREHPSDVFARLAQALLEIVEGRPEAARLLVRQVVLQRRTVGGVDGEVTYKVALLLARAGAREEAEAQLRQAVDQGFFCPRCLEREPSLAPLRTRPAYAESAARARERHVRFAQRFGLAAE